MQVVDSCLIIEQPWPNMAATDVSVSFCLNFYPAAPHEASLGTVCTPNVQALTPEMKCNLQL